ncbi:MAG: prepilin-type N-terminal cleavage/methylation domain-containing protein [Pseudomonadota bacterium]
MKLFRVPAGSNSNCRNSAAGERRIRSQQGFTLIEVILSLALTAMLLGLLSTGMYTVMNDWENDTSALDASLDETVAILQLERALQGAFPHSYRNPETLGRYVYFNGEDETLSWVSTVSPQRRGGLTAWYLESVDGEGVYLRLAPAMSDNPLPRLEETEPVLLLENYTARFSFLYEELDFSKRWREDWPGEELHVLPLAVHVLLTPLDSASRDEPLNIIARIRANEHRELRPSFTPGGNAAPGAAEAPSEPGQGPRGRRIRRDSPDGSPGTPPGGQPGDQVAPPPGSPFGPQFDQQPGPQSGPRFALPPGVQ